MSQANPSQRHMGFGEFVILMAWMISIVAMSIDAMLPALPAMGHDLGVVNGNDTQLIISSLFIGLATGTLIYGPLSDSWGRKPVVYIGFIVFIGASLMAYLATDFNTLLIARVLQGLGAAAPRILTIALVRDQYEGVKMARVMSLIMTIFILVPVVAPSIGQLILLLGSWRLIFAVYIAIAVLVCLWFAIRLPETLAVENRHPMSLPLMLKHTVEILRHPIALSYTVATGLFTGAFLGYLSSSQQIFQDIYQLGEQFPLYFAVLAISVGLASLTNAKLVMRFGMKVLSHGAMLFITLLSLCFFGVCLWFNGIPPLWMAMVYFLFSFFAIGLLFGNVNAIAMQPLGHIAGIGAGIVGSVGTYISIPIGIGVGQSFDGTLTAFVASLGICCLAALLIVRWGESRHLSVAEAV
ncbi:Bicyclomycin resistance protein [Sinobacterium norvegicum]|uniref:Bcr/CflA family efflux transporter n=1 Tax=Sinobacterium norvegicum TaxID=1641715 RepID=A0ABN8EIB3_9GAMM|nr:multidrug effflux MFS transporter [Sinobacterium norvegicum]CAH0990930.1 Bicyclomycin resistance protein [Sinobacterium norvegicum]